MATLDGGGISYQTTMDGGGIQQDDSNVLDGGSVSMTGPEDSTTAYGVTVQHVRELATHLGFDPAYSDPDFGPTRAQITDPMIAHWISLVSQSVDARTAALARFASQTDRWGVITGAARVAVTNGAASYLVAAAFPAKAGTNDQTSLSAELWRRYEAELDFLMSLGATFDADDEKAGTETGVSPRASYTPPSVPRGSGFFATDPRTAPYLDPNRMHPRTGGYPAPGAEGY